MPTTTDFHVVYVSFSHLAPWQRDRNELQALLLWIILVGRSTNSIILFGSNANMHFGSLEERLNARNCRDRFLLDKIFLVDAEIRETASFQSTPKCGRRPACSYEDVALELRDFEGEMEMEMRYCSGKKGGSCYQYFFDDGMNK
ncbi:unnamed protein product [Calypogeia fissa]